MQMQPSGSEIPSILSEGWTEDNLNSDRIVIVCDERQRITNIRLQALSPPQAAPNPPTEGRATSFWKTLAGLFSHKTPRVITVAKALDAIADSAIADSADVLKKKPSAGVTAEERISQLQAEIDKLRTLQDRLETHDTIVRRYNTHLFFGRFSQDHCSSHVKTEGRVAEQIQKLQYERNGIQRTQQAFITKQLGELRSSITSGLVIDRNFLATSYPEFNDQLVDLPPEERRRFQAEYRTIVNPAYLTSLIDQVDTDKMAYPHALHATLRALGYSDAQQSALLASCKADLLGFLRQRMQAEDLNQTPPSDLIRLVDDQLVRLVTQKMTEGVPPLPTASLAPLRAVLTSLLIFESDMDSRYNRVLGQVSMEAAMAVDRSVGIPAEKAMHRAYLAKIKPRSPVQDMVREVVAAHSAGLQQLMAVGGAGSETLKATIDRSLQQKKNRNPEELLSERCKAKFTEIEKRNGHKMLSKWVKDNQQACRFRFSQAIDLSADGLGAILGVGICQALNYRWIRAQMTHADTPPSLEAFAVGSESGAITARDRFLQASYKVAVGLSPSSTETLGMASHILRRDNLQFQVFENTSGSKAVFQSIADLIDDVAARELVPPGLVQIGALGAEGGHAIGMRIDRDRGQYSFWDVNVGYYTYTSLDAMKEGFATYLRASYPLEEAFTSFAAGQYSPIQAVSS